MLVSYRAPPQVADRGMLDVVVGYRGNKIPGADQNQHSKKYEMSTENEFKPTVQGRDTPVPVESGVPRTGPTRPSTRDCPAFPVADQAGTHEIATGKVEDEGEDRGKPAWCTAQSTPKTPAGSRGRLSIENTPPWSCKENKREDADMEGNIRIIDLTWDDEVDHPHKRKRVDDASVEIRDKEEDTAGTQGKWAKLLELVDLEARRLAKLVSLCPNTKKEIKESVAALRYMTSRLTSEEMTELRNEEQTKSKDKGADTAEAGCQVDTLDEGTAENKSETRKDESTQTERDTKPENKEERTLKMKTKIKETNTLEGLKIITNQDWPDEVYTATRHINGSVLQKDREADLVIWDEGEAAGLQTRAAVKKYEELRELKGEMAHLLLSTTTVDATGQRTPKERAITRLQTDGSNEDCFLKLTMVKNNLKERGSKSVAVYPPVGDERGDAFRKIAECVFAGTGVTCWVCYNNKKRKSEQRKRETDAIIIKGEEGRTFADLLKTVKEGIGKETKEKADNIQNIRKARDGGMVITLKPNQRHTGELKDAISKLPNIKARASTARRKGSGKVSMNLKGMDAITTREEVMAAIADKVEVRRDEIQIGELRPLYGSSQAVTVTMPVQPAEELIKKGGIRVGYNTCRVERRVALTQCYRCWGYGHRAIECKEEIDRSKDCHNCGQTGHQMKACKREKHCPLCNKDGHRAGAGICSKTRTALKEARGAAGKEGRMKNKKDVRRAEDMGKTKNG